MQVRTKKKASAQKPEGASQVAAQPYTFQAPVRGWIMTDSIADPQPAGASRLDNWWPTTRGAKMRGGSVKYATVPDPVETMFTYRSGTEHFFAATETDVYNISSVADQDVAVTATVTGQTSGDYSSVQYGTAGGDYLLAVNGADDLLLYDGSTFTPINAASSPAITGVLTSAFTHAWSHASRVWFVEGGSQSAWYLPADSIAGAATEFSLAGVFRLGGSLLFGASWSLNAGDGLDDKCVFVSTEGEVIIYEGTDPSNASTWALAGRYRLPKPISRRSHIQAGGDLLVATEVGLIPVSAAVTTDLGAIETKAVSRPITPYWQEQVGLTTSDWEIARLDEAGVMIVSQPVASSTSYKLMAVNMMTGAWSRITGWDAQCLGSFGGGSYFSDSDGLVFLMNAGGSDNGTPYTSLFIGQYESLGIYGVTKTVLQMRANLLAGTPVNPSVTALIEYGEEPPSSPSSPANFEGDVWDVGEWDVAVWDATTAAQTVSDWVSVGRTGSVVAPCLQLTSGTDIAPNVEIAAIEAQYVVGAAVA
ncbi:hypothetical protein [Celeribacter sp. SCSIO 80788]|uniref:hypothetical protein n=1 Tax=Celeribacter sp. SCSIO 80788 TaxID=3117013 RepID=UPI003DA5BD74